MFILSLEQKHNCFYIQLFFIESTFCCEDYCTKTIFEHYYHQPVTWWGVVNRALCGVVNRALCGVGSFKQLHLIFGGIDKMYFTGE